MSEFESHEHVQVVSQRVMNSFFRRGYAFFKTDHENSAWKKGDWLAHVTGSHPDERLKIMNELGACGPKISTTTVNAFVLLVHALMN